MSRRAGKRRGRKGQSLVVKSALTESPPLTDYERELLLPVAEKIMSELFELPGSDNAKENETED